MLLRTLAFAKGGVPEDFFIFVVLAQIRTAHDTQKRAIRHVQPSASLVCLRRWGTPILGVGAVSLIKEHSPDLVFLDVKMPGLDGFGVLKKIVERKMKMPHVVFATAFDQYAVQAFDVNAVDYVLKPFDKARIAKAITRARKMLETQTSATERLEQLVSQLGAVKQNSSPPVKILVRSQQKLLLIDGEDLIWASVERGSISIMARDVEGSLNYRTLEDLEEALNSDSFWRPHRSFLVNIHYIKEVVPWFNSTFMLKMNDKKHTEIPVSRSQIKRMRELFKL